MKVLLTGATGFIGTHVTRRLVAEGCEVLVLGRRPVELPGVENVLVSNFDMDSIHRALRGYTADAVFHLAAAGVDPGARKNQELIAVNGLLPATMVASARFVGATSVIVAGSCAEYLATDLCRPVTENAPLETGRLYGASKAAGGILAIAQGNSLGIPVAHIRLFNVYGPGEAKHRLLPSLYRGLIDGRSVDLTIATQVRDFVYIDDVCSGLITVLESLASGEISSGTYNLSTGIGHSVSDFCKEVARLMNVDESLLNFGALALRPDDVPYLVGDSSLLQERCGWQPAFGLSDGLELAIQEQANLLTDAGVTTNE